MRAVGGGLRLLLCMAAGIPLGSAVWVLWEALRHPWLGRAMLAHPLIALGTVTGAGGVASVAWGAAALAGIDLSRQAGVLHGCVVAAACAVHAWRDNPFRGT